MTLFAAALAWLVIAGGHLLGVPVWLQIVGACLAGLIAPSASRRRRVVNLSAVGILALIAAIALTKGGGTLAVNSIRGDIGLRERLLVSVDAQPDPHPGYLALNVSVRSRERDGTWQPAQGRARIVLAASADIQQDDELELYGLIEPAASSWSSEGYSAWLSRKGILAALAFPNVRLVNRPAVNALSRAWRNLRAEVDRGLRASLPANEALLASTVLYGGRHALPAGLAHDLEGSGLAHVAIVSAFNLVLLFGVVIALAAPVTGRRRAAWIAVAAALVYGQMSGGSAPVARGEVLIAFSALATVAGRRASGLHVLVIAAAVITLPDVHLLEDSGFQLTFAACAGVNLLAPALARIMTGATGGHQALAERGALVQVAVETVCISLGISLATAPVVMSAFGGLQTYSVVANAVVNPLLPLLTGLVLLTGLLGAVAPALAGFVAAPTWLLLRVVEGVAHLAAGAPGAMLRGPVGGVWPAMCWYIAVLGLVQLLERRSAYRRDREASRRWRRPSLTQHAVRTPTRWSLAAAFVGATVIAMLVAPPLLTAGAPRSEVRWLDAGQPLLFVHGRNGVRIVITNGDSPDRLAVTLQHVLGSGAAADVLITTRSPSSQAGLRPLVAAARALHAGSAVFPQAAQIGDAASGGVHLLPVTGGARVPLGGDDALDVLTSEAGDATLRITIGGSVLLLPGGRDAPELLRRWQDPVEADVVSMLRSVSVADRDLLQALSPRLVVASMRPESQTPLQAIAGPARAVELGGLTDARLSLRGRRLALSFSDTRGR